MVALFLDDNKTNEDGNGKENGKEVIGFYLKQNDNFAAASCHFVHFFSDIAPLRHETS